MSQIDYTAVQEFVALILRAQWERRSAIPYEYLRLSMMLELAEHLPEGIEVDHEYGLDRDGMTDVRLRRRIGWSL